MTTVSGKPLVMLLTAPAHGNDGVLATLASHLRTAHRTIDLWGVDEHLPGLDVHEEYERAHTRASVFLALASPATIGDSIWENGVQRALDAERAVIPVLLRPCRLEDSPIAKLSRLPGEGFALSEVPNLDRACVQILEAVLARTQVAVAEDQPILGAREAYLANIERFVDEAHPLGLPGDLAARLADLWTPLRVVRTGGAESTLRDFLKDVLYPATRSELRRAEGRTSAPAIWHLLGDPGSGKSWGMLRAAADLADLARGASRGPLPLLVTARDLAAANHPSAGLRSHPTTVGSDLDTLLGSRDISWLVLVDGLDEAGEAGNHAVAKVVHWLGERLVALLVSSRPTFIPRVGTATGQARVLPWGDDDAEEFLTRWERVNPEGVARLRSSRGRMAAASLLSSPQAATLCVLAMGAEDGSLTNRAALMEHVLQTLWKRRSATRSITGAPAIRWETVAPVLQRLAVAYLSEGVHALSESRIEKAALQVNPNMAVLIKDALVYDVGLLTRVRPGEVDFPFRGMAEHLFGRLVLDDCEKRGSHAPLVRLSRARWAEEGVRYAIIWAAYCAGPNRASDLVDALLQGE